MLLVNYLEPTPLLPLSSKMLGSSFPVGKAPKDQDFTSSPAVPSVMPIHDMASSMRGQQLCIILILLLLFRHEWLQHRTAQKNLLFALISALSNGDNHAGRSFLFRHSYHRSQPPRGVNSSATLRAMLLISAVYLWGRTRGLRGAHFKIMPQLQFLSLKISRQWRSPMPVSAWAPLQKEDEGFVFKGCNLEAILESFPVCALVTHWSGAEKNNFPVLLCHTANSSQLLGLSLYFICAF